MRRGFFDPGAPRAGRARQPVDPESGKPRALSISELTREIKTIVEAGFPSVWVEGEISNFKCYASGHFYFTLKDAGAQLPAVMFRASAERLSFIPEDGTHVLANGRVSVYEPRGAYQFMVERMEPMGLGNLAAAFERLKAKLAAEGLFDEDRKRPIPLFPRRVGIITSPSGAAVRDLLKVIFARWPMDIVFCGVKVQGDGAKDEIAEAIRLMNRLPLDERPDVLIVGRGGGSMEDLWAFNEEVVARAIAASEIPTVSAVGHEVDFTIADFVADVRAATPSHAGEMAVPRFEDTIDRLDQLRAALPAALLQRMDVARNRLQAIEQSYALRHPEERFATLRQRLDDLHARLGPAGERRAQRERERLSVLTARLESLSPLSTLQRGYSIAQRAEDKKVLNSIAEIADGATLLTRLTDGDIESVVKSRQPRKR